MAVSGLALVRSSEREKGIPADSAWQQVMDEHYGDEVAEKDLSECAESGVTMVSGRQSGEIMVGYTYERKRSVNTDDDA